MAKTKFLDYTGLAKLVEKIKNTYVNKNEQYEANLKWGGCNFVDSFGPIDGAMIPELGANRFAFGYPTGITIEYSNDGGSTWLDYEATDDEKLRLTSTGTSFILGKSSSLPPSTLNKLRITFDTLQISEGGIGCYAELSKFYIRIGTKGMADCYCTIQVAKNTENITYNEIATKVPIRGFPGDNIINVPKFRTAHTSNHINYIRKIRFIFGADSIYSDKYSNMEINAIQAFGGTGWQCPSNMADIGRLYKYDSHQNATFPANITANTFVGKLDGNANTASKLGTATIGSATKPMYLSGGTPTECTYTLAQNVTSASKLTDTTYSASTGLSLSKDNKFSINAATSSTIGGVKIGNNISITSGTISLTKANVTTALGYTPPTADTNTHYTTGLIVGNSSSSTGNTAVTTNGVFLNLKDDNNIRNSHKIVGGGATTVTSDSGGTITIHSTDKKVYQEVDTTTISSTPLLLSPLSEDTKMGEINFTTSAKINFNIVAVPKSGTLKATHFIGTTFSGDTFSGTTFTGNAATATSAITATYAKKYSYNGTDRDFVYDAAENEYHNIRCQDDTIISANRNNLNQYEFIINPDSQGGCLIYDKGISRGTFWGPDGIAFEKAPANSLVAANGTFATAISDTDIKNAINSAIDWT